MILILLLYMLFASTFTVGKIVVGYMPPILFIAVRMLIAGSILLGYQYYANRSQWKYEKQDVFWLFQIAVFLYFIAFVTEFWSLQYVSAAKACLLYNMSPFITALLVYFIFQYCLTKHQWVGLFIGFFGFLPILISQNASEKLTYHISFLSMPEVSLGLSVISSCYGWIIMKKMVVHRHYSPVMVNGITMLWAGIIALVTSLAIEGKPFIYPSTTQLFELSPYLSSWMIIGLCTAFLVLIAHIVCFNLYAHLLRYYSVTFIAFAGFTTPLFAALYDLIFLGQAVSISFFITIGFVLIGLYLFYQDELDARN